MKKGIKYCYDCNSNLDRTIFPENLFPNKDNKNNKDNRVCYITGNKIIKRGELCLHLTSN